MLRCEIKLQVLFAVIWDTFQLSIWKSHHLGHKSVAMVKEAKAASFDKLTVVTVGIKKTNLETGTKRWLFTSEWRTALEIIISILFYTHISYS